MSGVDFMVTVLALLASFGGAAQAQEIQQIKAWIDELDGLPEKPHWEEFVGREALWKLVAAGSDAAPLLSEAAYRSPSWSIRASAMFALAANRFEWGNDDDAPGRAWEGLQGTNEDPHPLVRAISWKARNIHATDDRPYMSGQKEAEQLLFHSESSGWRSPRDVGWLPEPYFRQRLDRMVAELGPEPSDRGVTLWSTDDYLPARAKAATHVLRDEQSGTKGHEVTKYILHALKSVEAHDYWKSYFLLAAFTSYHRDGNDLDHLCERQEEDAVLNQDGLAVARGLIERWQEDLDRVVGPMEAVHALGGMSALSEYLNHPSAIVRECAAEELAEGARLDRDRQESEARGRQANERVERQVAETRRKRAMEERRAAAEAARLASREEQNLMETVRSAAAEEGRLITAIVLLATGGLLIVSTLIWLRRRSP
jgi:hypothetical protein